MLGAYGPFFIGGNMEWEEFYERIDNWGEKRKKTEIKKLTSFGPSDEISDIVFLLDNEEDCSYLVNKALDHGVCFSAEEILDFMGMLDDKTNNRLVDSSKWIYSQEQLEDLYGFVDEDVIIKAAERSHVQLFEEENEEVNLEFYDLPQPPKQKVTVTDVILTIGLFHLIGNLFKKKD